MSRWPLVPPSLDLRLLTVQPPEGQTLVDALDPFVTLSDRGGYSRVLMAQVRGSNGRPVAEAALKLQSDEYPLPVPGDDVLTTNPDVVDRWEREVATLEAGRHPGMAAIVEVLDRAPGRPAHLPPLLFCKLREAYFPAPCPACGATLADVRDDAWLAARGLPAYSSTASRFLACPSCRQHDGARVWVLVREPEHDPAVVGDQADLFDSLAALARREVGATPVVPCQGCTEIDVCFPAVPAGSPGPGEAVRRLAPVTFYESEAIALEPFQLHWDEAMALVGGAASDDVVAHITEPGRRGYVGATLACTAGRRRFLFAHDPEGKQQVERLRIKLGLVRQLCQGVAELHRRSRAPHLALSPETVLVRLSDADQGLPVWWTLSVGVFGIGNARRRVVGAAVGSESDLVVYASSPRQDPIYVPGALTMAARDVPCVVTIERVTPLDGRAVALDLTVQCDAVAGATVTDKDVVTLSIMQGRPPLTLSLAGTPADPKAVGGMRVQAPRVELTPGSRDAVMQVVGRPITRARLSHHPCRQVPVDVHALGMLLFGALLADAEQPMAVVARAVTDCAVRLDGEARMQNLDFGALATLATQLVAERLDGPFAARHGAWDATTAPDGVPPALWTDLLVVGLRAVTQIPGFSICRGWGDFDARHPEVKVEYLLQLVDAAIGRVDAVLFGLPGRTSTMRRVLRAVARELQPRSNLD